MVSTLQDTTMPHRPLFDRPSLSRSARRLAGAFMAYLTAVGASVAAAAAVVNETLPWISVGF
jgi:hypothetical protein